MNWKLVALFAATFAAGVGLTYFVVRRDGPGDGSGAGGSASAVVRTSGSVDDAVRDLAQLLVRAKGTFTDFYEFNRVEEKLKAAKAEVIAFGPKGFDAVVAFLARESRDPEAGGREPLHRDPEVRGTFVELLRPLDPKRAAPALARHLADGNEHGRVRAKASGELALSDREVAIPALIAALDNASERAWDGCQTITEGLTYLGGDEVGACLLRAFQRGSTEMGLRIAVAEALERVRYKPAATALETCIRMEDSNHYVRRVATRALASINGPRADALADELIPKEQDSAFREFLVSFRRDRMIR